MVSSFPARPFPGKAAGMASVPTDDGRGHGVRSGSLGLMLGSRQIGSVFRRNFNEALQFPDVGAKPVLFVGIGGALVQIGCVFELTLQYIQLLGHVRVSVRSGGSTTLSVTEICRGRGGDLDKLPSPGQFVGPVPDAAGRHPVYTTYRISALSCCSLPIGAASSVSAADLRSREPHTATVRSVDFLTAYGFHQTGGAI
jgi:hypothetical protein